MSDLAVLYIVMGAVFSVAMICLTVAIVADCKFRARAIEAIKAPRGKGKEQP